MRKILGALLAGLVMMAAVAPLVADEAANVKSMAAIVAKLQHFPSDAEKKTLQAIVDDKTASMAEHTIATAIINLQHSATPADKTKLEAITKDASVSAPLKTLAGIVGSLMHQPTAADKMALEKLANPK